MSNQRGQLTVDFIFAIVLVLGFTALLFVLTFTLSVASITQYITFSAARNYSAAHIDQTSQIKQGQDKYHELIADSVVKPLYSNGWFKVDADSYVGDATQTNPGYLTAAQDHNQFWGVGTNFVAPILDFHIPFFGSTAPDGDGSGLGFKTYIGSYTGREPTEDECIKFTAQRWKQIRQLQVQAAASYSTGTGESGYHPMTDDGC